MDLIISIIHNWMNKYVYQLHIEQEIYKFHNPIKKISFTIKNKTLQKNNFHKPINAYKRTTFTSLSMQERLLVYIVIFSISAADRRLWSRECKKRAFLQYAYSPPPSPPLLVFFVLEDAGCHVFSFSCFQGLG